MLRRAQQLGRVHSLSPGGSGCPQGWVSRSCSQGDSPRIPEPRTSGFEARERMVCLSKAVTPVVTHLPAEGTSRGPCPQGLRVRVWARNLPPARRRFGIRTYGDFGQTPADAPSGRAGARPGGGSGQPKSGRSQSRDKGGPGPSLCRSGGGQDWAGPTFRVISVGASGPTCAAPTASGGWAGCGKHGAAVYASSCPGGGGRRIQDGGGGGGGGSEPARAANTGRRAPPKPPPPPPAPPPPPPLPPPASPPLTPSPRTAGGHGPASAGPVRPQPGGCGRGSCAAEKGRAAAGYQSGGGDRALG